MAHIALVELSHTGKDLGGAYSGRHWLGMIGRGSGLACRRVYVCGSAAQLSL